MKRFIKGYNTLACVIGHMVIAFIFAAFGFCTYVTIADQAFKICHDERFSNYRNDASVDK